MNPYVVIGAGPMGLCTVRRLAEKGIKVLGFEAHSDVGGLWDIDSPTSTMYESAHLISSKRMTEFDDFPMSDDVATYPRHDQLKHYFQSYATHFDLYRHYQFNCWVESVEPHNGQWRISYRKNDEQHQIIAAGVLLANGTLHHPNVIDFPGHFNGEQMHSAQYKSADIFADKRVLIVGCGNSGCDIAVDAVHRAKHVDMVVRRGYYFLPKFVAGIPTDKLLHPRRPRPPQSGPRGGLPLMRSSWLGPWPCHRGCSCHLAPAQPPLWLPRRGHNRAHPASVAGDPGQGSARFLRASRSGGLVGRARRLS